MPAKKINKKVGLKKVTLKGAAERAQEILRRLETTIPQPRCELDFENPWQLIVAVILSAQSTDKTINRVTPALFKRWSTPRALAEAPQEEVELVVRSTGYYRSKAKAIRETSRRIADDFHGEVPRAMEELLSLPGVARKTANVVLGTAYGMPSGFVVDTHVIRLSARLGLSAHSDPKRIEEDLCKLFPRQTWIDQSHRILLHGRYICQARAPQCAKCPLFEICPSRQTTSAEGSWTTRAAGEAQVINHRGILPETHL